jgi:hypothetical protein
VISGDSPDVRGVPACEPTDVGDPARVGGLDGEVSSVHVGRGHNRRVATGAELAAGVRADATAVSYATRDTVVTGSFSLAANLPTDS